MSNVCGGNISQRNLKNGLEASGIGSAGFTLQSLENYDPKINGNISSHNHTPSVTSLNSQRNQFNVLMNQDMFNKHAKVDSNKIET